MIETALIVVHVLAAATWVGGTIALVFVAVPVVRQLEGPARAAALAGLGRRWRPLGWGALAVLVATGAGLAAERGAFASTDATFDVVFALKLTLVAALGVVACLHDFVLGPGLSRQIREGRPQTLRRRLVVVGWTSFALTLAVPILGVTLAELAG